MTNTTYRALHNITPDDAQRLNTNLDMPWPVSGSQTLTHYGKDGLATIAQHVNVWQNNNPENTETENDIWELQNHQPIQTPTLTPKQLLITLSVPVSLFAGLVTLITL